MYSTKEKQKRYDEAYKTLHGWYDENDVFYWQPNKDLSKIGWRYVHLWNSVGMYAKYNMQTKKIVSK